LSFNETNRKMVKNQFRNSLPKKIP